MASVEYRGMNLIIPDNDSEWREHFKLARGHKLMLRACKACNLMDAQAGAAPSRICQAGYDCWRRRATGLTI